MANSVGIERPPFCTCWLNGVSIKYVSSRGQPKRTHAHGERVGVDRKYTII
jgi:hypothetical protein